MIEAVKFCRFVVTGLHSTRVTWKSGGVQKLAWYRERSCPEAWLGFFREDTRDSLFTVGGETPTRSSVISLGRAAILVICPIALGRINKIQLVLFRPD